MNLNRFEVVGTLKSMNLIQDTKNGIGIVRGNMIIEVVDGEKINNIDINVYAPETFSKGTKNRAYPGLITAMNEYKAIDDYGREEANVVSASGQDSYNVYSTKDGDKRESNRLQLSFISRQDKNAEQKAILQVKAVIMGYDEEFNQDGEPNGMTKINAINIGYGERINKLVGLKVSNELGMDNFFQVGDVANLSVNIENYATVSETKTDSTAAFGNFIPVVRTSTYTRQLLVSGGSYTEEEPFQPEDFEAIQSGLTQSWLEAQQRNKDKNNTPTQAAFGKVSSSNSNPFNATETQVKTADLPF